MNGVIGEMDEAVLQVLEGEFFAGSADVALFVPIGLDDVVD